MKAVEMSAPSRLNKWLAVAIALVTFRLMLLLFRALFFGIEFLAAPVSLIHFLSRWDILIAHLGSVAVAILMAKWGERALADLRARLRLLACVILTVIACLPLDVRFMANPVMSSPLAIAIDRGYSVDTMESLIERYPHLVNASTLDKTQYHPLVHSAFERKTNVVDLLIRKGADVDAAVKELLQSDAEEAVRLVLDSAGRNSVVFELQTQEAEPNPAKQLRAQIEALKQEEIFLRRTLERLERGAGILKREEKAKVARGEARARVYSNENDSIEDLHKLEEILSRQNEALRKELEALNMVLRSDHF